MRVCIGRRMYMCDVQMLFVLMCTGIHTGVYACVVVWSAGLCVRHTTPHRTMNRIYLIDGVILEIFD